MFVRQKLLALVLGLLGFAPGPLRAGTVTVSNAEPRRDTRGEILDAHDGCLEYFAGRFYLYGTRYGKTDGFGKSNRYVGYSSPDLTTWTPLGELLKDAPPRTYYRPYVKFNQRTGKYVMWYNADNQYGVAVADQPAGPFSISNPNVPVKYSGRGIGDMGLFVDTDGTGYLTYTVGVGGDFGVKVEPIPHHQICVERLTPDYLGSAQETSAFVAGNCESPAMFIHDHIYYLLFDNTCCFCPEGSGARVYTATAPLGPFAYRGNVNLKGASARDTASPWTSPGSGRPDCIIQAQQTHVATLPTPSGIVYLWMGDRWGSRPDGIKGHDFQYWSSPLQFDQKGMIQPLTWEDHWQFEVGSGPSPSAALLPAPAGKPLDHKLPIDGQVFDINGHTAFLILPKQRPATGTAAWVWYAPTLPGLPGPEERWMFEKLLAAGIAIGGVDVGESYGSPDGCAVFSALYKELVEKRGLSPKACLLARSRGGLMLYNWATVNPESVACIAGIYPVCNLASFPGLAKAGGAYKLTEAELAAQLTRHNPIDRLAPLAKAKVPIFHLHGDADNLVPLEANSGELARRYRELGGSIELVIPPGQGHNMWPGFFECQELVDFLIKHAQPEAPRKSL